MFQKKVSETLKVTLLSLTLVIFSLWFQGNIGIDLADEGFLWYGTIQTASGAVPIRDFQSYDPGRYYLTAFWSILLGEGIISLRISLGIFQFIGLTLGLLALRGVIRSWWILAIAGFLLLVWMIPRHKIFESSLAMAGVYFAFCLIKEPSFKQHFISGIFVGIAAFLGRNHGLYNFLAFFLLILLIWFKLDRTHFVNRIGSCIAGVLLGFLPMLIMLLIVPGFFDSFIEIFMTQLHKKYTNFPLPIPWPWKYDYSRMNLLQSARAFSEGSFFLLLPFFYIFTTINILWSKRDHLQQKALLIATTFVGVMYMHYSFSRADLPHLAQGIHPFLIGLLAFPFSFNFNHKKILNTGLLLLLLAATFFSAGMASPYYRKASAPSEAFIKYDITGDYIWINKEIANLIDTIKQINFQIVPQHEGFLIAPHWPTFYPILQRESPLWDIYLLFPENKARQKEMIEELKVKEVNWVILCDVALDGRDDLRFCNTHKLLWQHFRWQFETVKVQGLSHNYILLHRKSKGK